LITKPIIIMPIAIKPKITVNNIPNQIFVSNVKASNVIVIDIAHPNPMLITLQSIITTLMLGM
jgi:hypothetical protein